MAGAGASRYPMPDIAELPDDIRQRILAVQEKSGFVPNVFLSLARRPEEFRAFFAYHDALMDKPGKLSKADITASQRAMLDFAMKVSQQSYAIGDEDFQVLQQHGFDNEDAWDIAAIAAFFGLSNRMANATGMRPNREFYAMGR